MGTSKRLQFPAVTYLRTTLLSLAPSFPPFFHLSSTSIPFLDRFANDMSLALSSTPLFVTSFSILSLSIYISNRLIQLVISSIFFLLPFWIYISIYLHSPSTLQSKSTSLPSYFLIFQFSYKTNFSVPFLLSIISCCFYKFSLLFIFISPD